MTWMIEKAEYSWPVVLEKTLESPSDFKEIKLVNPKGNQSQIFIGKTDAEAEALMLWPPDAKSWMGKIEGKSRMWQKMRWLDSITDSMDTNLNKLQKIAKDRVAWHAVVYGVAKSWTWLSDWTTITKWSPAIYSHSFHIVETVLVVFIPFAGVS